MTQSQDSKDNKPMTQSQDSKGNKPMTRSQDDRTYRLTLTAMLTVIALMFSYVEAMIPITLGIPGFKLGFANIMIIIALYALDARYAFAVNLARILMSALLFGNPFSMLYSLAGGILSLVCMIAAKKSGLFGRTGVSIIGGVMHNAGQLAVAAAVVENANVFWYLPVLMASGIVTGALIGLLAALVMERLPSF